MTTLFSELEQDLLIKFQNKNRIGFFISGGFDSTVLLLAACEIRKKNNLNIEYLGLTVPRSDNSLDHANRVVTWINGKFLSNIDIISVGNPNLHHSVQVRFGCKKAKDYNYADLYLLADTAIPIDLENDAPERIRSDEDLFYQPWFDKTKDYVVRLAAELDIEEISKITHTCTESKTIRCGKCWQCRERQWAFQQVAIEDFGKM